MTEDKIKKLSENQRLKLLYDNLRNEINTIINKDYLELNLNREETRKREVQQRQLKNATRNAGLGDLGAREYLKGYIKDLLQSKMGISESTLELYIPFKNPLSMSSQDKFELLYMLFQKEYVSNLFGKMVEYFKWDSFKFDSDGRPYYSIDENDISRAYANSGFKGDYNDKLNVLVQRCYQNMYGHDCVDLLMYDTSIDGVSGGVGGRTREEYNYLLEIYGEGENNIYSRNYDMVFCVLHGKLFRLNFLSFGNQDNLERVVKNIYRFNARTTLSQKNPILHGTLKNGSRVVVARPPVSDGWTFYVRKFMSTDARKIESLITHKNSELVINFLKIITQGELNFVISGPMGSGKTTLLKSLVKFMNPQYTIRVAESSFELNLNNLYPERNIHVMQERGNVSIYDILTATKKMDTDIMIVGEINEPKLAGAYIQVSQSGSRMAVTTLHHETTQKLIEYLRNSLVSECGISDVKIAEKQVTDVLNFDVHVVKDLKGNFYIERITEIIPENIEEYPRKLEEGTLEYYRRVTDRHSYEISDVLIFNKQTQEYEIKNKISKHTAGLLLEKVPIEYLGDYYE